MRKAQVFSPKEAIKVMHRYIYSKYIITKSRGNGNSAANSRARDSRCTESDKFIKSLAESIES